MNNENIDEGKVEQLLKGAGRRTPIPDDVRDRLEQSFRTELRSTRQKRAITQWSAVSGMAALLLVAVFVDFGGGVEKPIESVAQVIRDNGNAIRHFGEERIALGSGSKLYQGETIVTNDGPLSVQPGGSTIDVRIAANSEVVFAAPGIVELHRGSIYVDSHPDTDNAPLQVVVDDLVVSHIGTQFLVSRDRQAVEISVREGIVQMTNDNDTFISRANEDNAELSRFDKGNLVTQSSISMHDHRWLWVTKLAPEIQTKGLHLHEFMQWVQRQTGYVVSYELELTDIHRIKGDLPTSDVLEAMDVALSIMDLKADMDETKGAIIVSAR